MTFTINARTLLATALAGTALVAAPAMAAPVLVNSNVDLTGSPFSVSIGGDSFTFSATGDIFAPLAVQTAGNAAISAFGGFLGIPISPTSSFTNRGTVTYGPGAKFEPFAATTTVPFSNGENFIGLRATVDGEDFYGFAFTANNVFRGYGFETTANTAITATTALGAAAVPEPAAWALMIVGFGAVGTAMRRRQHLSFRHA